MKGWKLGGDDKWKGRSQTKKPTWREGNLNTNEMSQKNLERVRTAIMLRIGLLNISQFFKRQKDIKSRNF